jgi:hypothetical protein
LLVGALLAACRSRALEQNSSAGASTAGATAAGATAGGAAAGGAAAGGAAQGGASDGVAGQDTTSGAAGKPNPATQCASSSRGVPEGWQPLALYGSRCVYVPPTREKLPKGLTWTACATKAASLTSCREIAIDWTTDGTNATGGSNEAFVDADGHVVFALRRMYEDHAKNQAAAMAMVVEVDGQVRQALWDPYDDARRPAFWLLAGGVGEHKAAWSLFEFGSNPARRAGFGGNDLELEPKQLFALAPGRGVPRPGKTYFAETSQTLTVRSWDDARVADIAESSGNVPRWAGDVLFWTRDGGAASELRIWTESTGSVLLRGFGADGSRTASQLGTDGTDLVWLEGSERAAIDSPYPIRAIYTAPFTTDPERLQPRRLRSWLPEILSSTYPPAVGCGRAAFFHPRPGNAADPSGVFRDILLVRLSDGVAWRIESPETYQFDAAWTLPLALTCKELFVGAGLNVRRIALEALADSSPAD